MKTPPIVSPQEWETARQQLLVKEKALTRARDALAAERRRMPWQPVEKKYEFDGPKGKASLLDLFEGRRQLIVYRAFLEPGVRGWPEHACIGCSMVADQVAHVAHLNARDTTLVFVSRALQTDIERVKTRMGWEMPWYTITDDFDTDFGVDEWHGTNAFIRDGDSVFRTYFVNNRGDEAMGSTWSYLDLTALGRQEEWEDSPEGYPQTPPYEWWIWHDEILEAGEVIEMNTALNPHFEHTGGCACGAIRYECTAEPVAMFCCHCRDCQRASGGAGNYVVIMPADSFKFTRGAPRYHFTTSAKFGHHKRGFCAECGSRLTGGRKSGGHISNRRDQRQ